MAMTADPNNNTHEEKSYSLRPRAALRKEEDDTDPEEWRPRGRVKRRPKQKNLPLSKYRRKTANARERSRMREINDAFEALRRVLPHCKSRSDTHQEKTTKIMTLRMAMKYIAALDSALRQAEGDSDAESLISDSLTASSFSDLDQLLNTTSFDEWPSPLRPSTTTMEFSTSVSRSSVSTPLLQLSPQESTPLDLQDWRDLNPLPSPLVHIDDLFIT